MKLVMEYKRLTTEVNGEYPYTGKFIVPGQDPAPFIGWTFKKLVAKLSDLLNADDELDDVIFQRVDRPNIMPMGLGPQLLNLLRKDPLSAYRQMTFDPMTKKGGLHMQRERSSEHAAIAEVFGRFVYLEMQKAVVLCPLTGEWKTLAYGEKYGWKVRGDGNSHGRWVPIEELIDDSPEGSQGMERLAFCTWAKVDVKALIDLGCERYYLPRRWNVNGPWISRADLERMIEEHGV